MMAIYATLSQDHVHRLRVLEMGGARIALEVMGQHPNSLALQLECLRAVVCTPCLCRMCKS